MPKNTLLKTLLPLMLLSPFFYSCSGGNSLVSLPYGTLYDSSLKAGNHFTKIDYSSFLTLVEGTDSVAPTSFIVVVRGASEGCLCWTSLEANLEKYCSSFNLCLYLMTLDDFSSHDYKGLDLKKDVHTLGIYDNGSLKYHLEISDSSLYSTDYNVLKDWFLARVSIAPLYYINKNQLDSLFASGTESFMVGYVRKTCGDCTYALTHSVFSYSSSFKRPGYLFDCDVENVRFVNGASPKTGDEATEDEKAAAIQWQAFKDDYGLSSKYTTFGYGNGFVPTFTWNTPSANKADGVKDAFVWGNESLKKNQDGTFHVASAYLDGTRNDGKGEDNPFLTDGAKDILSSSGVKETNFLNITSIPASDVYAVGEDGYWLHKASRIYDDPLLLAFLSFYLK